MSIASSLRISYFLSVLDPKLKNNPILFYISRHKLSFCLGILFLFITNATDSLLPLLIKRGIDQITDGVALNEILITAISYLAMTGLLALGRFSWRFFYGKFHTYAGEDLRQRLFNHYTTLGPNYFNRQTVGELMSLISSDVNQVRQTLAGGLLMSIDAVMLFFMLIPMMFYINPIWTIKCLSVTLIMPFIVWKLMNLIRLGYKNQQDKLAELTGFSTELVSGIRVVKSYAQEQNKLKEYNKFSKTYEQASNRVSLIDALFNPVWTFGALASQCVLLLTGIDDIMSGAVSLGTFIAFQRYLFKMTWPLNAIGMSLSSFQKGKASFERICQNLETQSDIPDVGTNRLESFESLEVKNLSFKYPGSEIQNLKNINFKIEAGEKIGIVGSVGSGKSTLFQLLNRLIPPTSGEILINNKKIDEYTQESLHKTLVLVPQEPFLFSESIEENILFGQQENQNFSLAQKVSNIVDIHNEIECLPAGYKSQLGERGVNLSGGQKQRLTLARGLVVNAKVLMLDDVLSAVDAKTESKIENALKEHDQSITLILSTHRISTLKLVNKIIVLNTGEIEAIGTHKELLISSPTYKSMYDTQNNSQLEVQQ